MKIRILAILAVLCAWLGAAQAQDKLEILPQMGHSGSVNSVAFSPRGQLLATSGEEGTIILWDLASGRNLRTLSGHLGPVNSVAFSPDGKILASAGADNTIKLWDVASGREIRTLTGHLSEVTSVAFSLDGHMLASAANDGVKFWDAQSGKDLPSRINLADSIVHRSQVQAILFSPDGHSLAEVRSDGTVDLWDVASDTRQKTFTTQSTLDDPPSDLQSVAFSPNGKMLATGRKGGSITLWDTVSGRELRTLTGHSAEVTSVAFSPDGRMLASGSTDRWIKLWDVTSGREVRALGGLISDNPSVKTINSVAFSPDGRMLASGTFGFAVELWDVPTGRALRTLGARSDRIVCVAFSPDGRMLATGTGPGKVKVWDMASGSQSLTLNSNSLLVQAVAYSPDGHMLASGGTAGIIELWDVASGRQLHTLSGHKNWINSVAFSREGQIVASASKDGTVKLWDVASGRELRTLAGHSAAVNIVAFSPDGSILASGSDDKTIKLWDVASGHELRTLNERLDVVSGVAFSPDGRTIAANGGFTIDLWDVASGHPLPAFNGPGHSSFIFSVAFSPNGRLLASAGYDHTIKLWDVAGRRELQTLNGHLNAVRSVQFSPDGRVLASGSWDDTARLWDVSSGSERVSLVAFIDGSSLAITPEGFFESSSAQAEENLNVRVGDRVFGIASYRENFYRPDLVKLSLSGNSLRGLGFASIGGVKLAPVIELIGLPASTGEPKLNVTLRITDGGGGIGLVRLFMNGTAVVQDDTPVPPPAQGAPQITRNYTLQLPSGPNELRAVAFNAENNMQSNPAAARITVNLPRAPRGTLHAIVVGIQEFKNPSYDLHYAVSDAQLVAQTLEQYSPPLFQKLDVKLLIKPEETTRESLIQALKDMQSVVGADDLFVFYVSSHGNIVYGEYFLATSNVESSDRLKTEALSDKDLTNLLANIPAPDKLVIIDTCHAQKLGKALDIALQTLGMNDSTATTILSRSLGLTVLAATKSDEDAQEGYNDHGLFTYVIADGLQSTKIADENGLVTTFLLAHYVSAQVPKLATSHFRHDQHPAVNTDGEEFPLTKVK